VRASFRANARSDFADNDLTDNDFTDHAFADNAITDNAITNNDFASGRRGFDPDDFPSQWRQSPTGQVRSLEAATIGRLSELGR